MNIAYLGPEFSFSHQATKLIKSNSNIIALNTVSEVVDRVANAKNDLGVIPFWNPYQAHIRESQKKLLKSHVIINKVIRVNPKMCLGIKNKNDLNNLKYIYSNKHVFKQCSVYLKKHYPNIGFKEVNSTSKSVEVVKNKRYAAAIASIDAIVSNGLICIEKNIQNKGNYTLFAVIEKNGDTLKNKKGNYTLFLIKLNDMDDKSKITNIFQDHSLDSSLKWIFPLKDKSGQLWEFLEIYGSPYDLDVSAFKNELNQNFKGVKIIGCYNESIRSFC